MQINADTVIDALATTGEAMSTKAVCAFLGTKNTRQVKNDNRWINLNASTCLINMKNQKLRCDNTSGHCGVGWNKHAGKWQVQTRVNGKRIWLGYFTELSDAIAARKAADIKYNFHVNHGKAA